MNSKAYLSVVTFPLVTSAVLLAYACATQDPATEASLPIAHTVAISKPLTGGGAKSTAASHKKSSKGPLTLAVEQQAARDDKDDKDERKVTRYVAVESLNVRSRPKVDAEVVAKLARGSMLPVVIDGAWARLGDEQWIQVRYLSDQKPHAKGKRRMLSKR